MDLKYRVIVMALLIIIVLIFGAIIPYFRKRNAEKAFGEIVDVMNNVSFDVDKFNLDQLQIILSRIAKKIYIPSWYTRDDIGSLFKIHGIDVEDRIVNEIFNELLENNSIIDSVTEALWLHVNKCLNIGGQNG